MVDFQHDLGFRVAITNNNKNILYILYYMWNRISKCFKVRMQLVFKPSLRKKYVNISLIIVYNCFSVSPGYRSNTTM